MQRLAMLAAAVAILVSTVASGSAAPESCAAGHDGRACATSTSPGQKVAEALAAERMGSPEDPRLELLQRSAGGVEKAAKAALTVNVSDEANVSTGSSLTGEAAVHANHSAGQVAALERAIRALEKAKAKQNRTAQRANYTRGEYCSQYTGGSCLLTGECAESRSAVCRNGMCVCSDYTCNDNGRCALSVSEIANAVENGVSGVAEQVTNIATIVPGIANSVGGLIGAVGGIGDTLGGIIGSLTGADMGNCNSRYVGTCFFSGCDQSMGYTVSCEYGSCQCKEGFCSQGNQCMVDINGLMINALGAMQAATS